MWIKFGRFPRKGRLIKFMDNPLEYNFAGFEITLLRKKIKNLHLKVNTHGGIRVSAPHHIPIRKIEAFILDKSSWIQKQVGKSNPADIPKKYTSGEKHFVQGKGLTLEVRESKSQSQVKISESTLILEVPENTTVEQREKILSKFYRSLLAEEVPRYIQRYEPVMGVKVLELRFRKMKTRWGTCNYKAQRIWVNLEMAKKSPDCLEYLTVHEMVHLLEPSHNARFKNLMDKYLPDWRDIRKKLHEN